MDADLGKDLQRSLKKMGMKMQLSTKVTAVKATTKQVTLTAENKKGESIEMKADYCLVSVGRKPYTDKLGLDNVGIELNERGQIPVNEKTGNQSGGNLRHRRCDTRCHAGSQSGGRRRVRGRDHGRTTSARQLSAHSGEWSIRWPEVAV